MRALRLALLLPVLAPAASAQAPAAILAYDVPAGWVLDAPGARKADVELMFLPRGKTPESTDRAIAIAYQGKDSKVPALASLENFVRADMSVTRQSYPDMLAERWQPKALDPTRMQYMSVELYGSKPDRPPPHRVVMIDSGDGFYSITYTAQTRAILHEPEVDAFFDSLRLRPEKEKK